ncbi:MAG: RNA polymerase sigma factor [Planctomycetes bacterium]|nr:RNA polymerase sigma factor [Planctomycetota bacterium]
MDPRTDEQLLAEHATGRGGAIDVLVGRYVHELYGFLTRFVGNNSIADDLVQETFVQVHLAAASFDQQRTFKPWLYTIAANKARDYLRSRGRRQETTLDAGIDEDGPTASQLVPADEQPQGEASEREERKAAVRALVDQMPEHLRLVLLLGYFQQMPYADIAGVLDIPVGTVKSRLHAAVNHFAELWRRHTNESETVIR